MLLTEFYRLIKEKKLEMHVLVEPRWHFRLAGTLIKRHPAPLKRGRRVRRCLKTTI